MFAYETLDHLQIMKLDHFLHNGENKIYKCPNHPNTRTLEASDKGIACTRCDFKVPLDKIEPSIIEITPIQS